jgi:hypothetical protein
VQSVFIFTVLTVFTIIAQADVFVTPGDYSGFRSTPAANGVSGICGWSQALDCGDVPKNNPVADNGFRISWLVEDLGSTFKYNYTVSGAAGVTTELSRALSHIIIQTSNGASITQLTGNPGIKETEGPKTFQPHSGAQPGMPGDLYGISVAPPDGTALFTFSFVSQNRPVWGDFYAKDGNDGPTYAYNAGFGVDPGCFAANTCGALGSISGLNLSTYEAWIVRPDSVVVPEPGFYGLLSMGLTGLWVVARRRRAA